MISTDDDARIQRVVQRMEKVIAGLRETNEEMLASLLDPEPESEA